jgi:hypothetical protein
MHAKLYEPATLFVTLVLTVCAGEQADHTSDVQYD